MNKRFLQFLLIAITTGIIFSSCSKDEELTGTESNEQTQIRLTSAINQLATRSTAQNTQIESGQEVGLVVANNPFTAVLYDNIKLTADGSGGFTYPSTMYYPSDGAKVDLMAYHPYNESVTGIGSAYTFGIQADQTLKANYLNSDVLFGSVEHVSRTTSAVPIEFNHLFSKLTFTVKKGNGASLEGLSSIEVLGLSNEALVDFEKRSVVADGTATTINVYNVPTGTASDLQLTGAAAIVVPQTVKAGQTLLRVTIGDVVYLYAPTAALELAMGTAYNYTITVNMAGITVTSSIVDWQNGGNIDGEGEIA